MLLAGFKPVGKAVQGFLIGSIPIPVLLTFAFTPEAIKGSGLPLPGINGRAV